ncbi:hypothetical protein M885DRAFT_525396 [Pelagophyceae sp. CCMP2097]|nr:hypothetical protein M885DRAFT_525396 [Pelagophyceae sp. CCMP2097]
MPRATEPSLSSAPSCEGSISAYGRGSFGRGSCNRRRGASDAQRDERAAVGLAHVVALFIRLQMTSRLAHRPADVPLRLAARVRLGIRADEADAAEERDARAHRVFDVHGALSSKGRRGNTKTVIMPHKVAPPSPRGQRVGRDRKGEEEHASDGRLGETAAGFHNVFQQSCVRHSHVLRQVQRRAPGQPEK